MEATQGSLNTPHPQKVALNVFEPPVSATAEEGASQQDVSALRKRMKFVKWATPMVLAIMRRPGLDGDSADKKMGLQQLIQSCREESDFLASVFGSRLDGADRAWLSETIGSQVSEWIAAQWGLYGKVGVHDEVKALINAFPDVSDLDDLVIAGAKNAASVVDPALKAGLRVSLINASVPVMQVVYDHDQVTAPEQFFFELQDALIDHVARVPMPTNLDRRTRLECLQNMLNASGRIMSSVLGKVLDNDPDPTPGKVIQTWQGAMAVLDRLVSAKFEVFSSLLADRKVEGKGLSL